MSQTAITLAAAERTIATGAVLHVRAAGLDLTVGPALAGYLVVDYVHVRSGEEEPFATAEGAIHRVRRLLGWERLGALRAALVRVHGGTETAPSFAVEASRQVERGARLAAAFGHRGGIAGCMGGPGYTAHVAAERYRLRAR